MRSGRAGACGGPGRQVRAPKTGARNDAAEHHAPLLVRQGFAGLGLGLRLGVRIAFGVGLGRLVRLAFGVGVGVGGG